MPVLEALIRKLLADKQITYFNDSAVFRNQILNNPEATALLLTIITTETDEMAARAGEMLSQFEGLALPSILEELQPKNTELRINLLMISWAVVTNTDYEDRHQLLQSAIPYLLPLLSDQSALPSIEIDHPVEIEFEDYRICDEAYVLLRYIQHGDFDDVIFRDLEYEERDLEIRAFQRGIERLVA